MGNACNKDEVTKACCNACDLLPSAEVGGCRSSCKGNRRKRAAGELSGKDIEALIQREEGEREYKYQGVIMKREIGVGQVPETLPLFTPPQIN